MKRFLPLMLALPLIVLGAETVTETPGPIILYLPDGTTKAFKTYAECLAAAPIGAEPVKSQCRTVMYIVKQGACDPAVEPALPDTIEAVATVCPNDATRWYNRIDGWKRDAFPSCAWQLVKLPESTPPFCTAPLAELMRGDPATIAENPAVDPEFDENSETGPVDGPGEGPGNAPPVDQPDLPTAHNHGVKS